MDKQNRPIRKLKHTSISSVPTTLKDGWTFLSIAEFHHNSISHSSIKISPEILPPSWIYIWILDLPIIGKIFLMLISPGGSPKRGIDSTWNSLLDHKLGCWIFFIISNSLLLTYFYCSYLQKTHQRYTLPIVWRPCCSCSLLVFPLSTHSSPLHSRPIIPLLLSMSHFHAFYTCTIASLAILPTSVLPSWHYLNKPSISSTSIVSTYI